MTAREMFENLGYGYRELDDDVFQYSRSNSIAIRFYKKEREFCSVEFFGPKNINMDEFKAIQQQLKELGWIEEETCTNKTYKKPTYKLTQCEYDMLDTIFEKEDRFSKVYLIGELKKKGYFKNIKCNSNVRVKNILANCEVVG